MSLTFANVKLINIPAGEVKQISINGLSAWLKLEEPTTVGYTISYKDALSDYDIVDPFHGTGTVGLRVVEVARDLGYLGYSLRGSSTKAFILKSNPDENTRIFYYDMLL